MISKALLWSFVAAGTLAALAFSALEITLLGRILLHRGDALIWALFGMAALPCLLAGWAVPLAVAYRLVYDRRAPAGLPSWRQAGRIYLMAHYRNPFWRAYASLFTCSLLFWVVYLAAGNWWLIGLEFLALAYAASRSYLRQIRLNQAQVVTLQAGAANIPPFGQIPWSELELNIQKEVTVTPKRDQVCWWITVNGQPWKSCELPEQAQAIVDWIWQTKRSEEF